MGKGVTIYNGKRGYGKGENLNKTDVIYSVITRLEMTRLQTEIQKIDSDAFIIMNKVMDLQGGHLLRTDSSTKQIETKTVKFNI